MEIDQWSQSEFRKLKVGQHLGCMLRQQLRDGFNLNDDLFPNKKIDEIRRVDQHAFIHDGQALLTRIRDAAFLKLNLEARLIGGF